MASSEAYEGVAARRRSGTTFEVQVRRSGDGWWAYAPAFGTGRFVSEESEIPAVARGMIAACGAAPTKFDIELELGRVMDSEAKDSLKLV